MNKAARPYFILLLLHLLGGSLLNDVQGQFSKKGEEKVKRASRKIEAGYNKNNPDTLAQGYYDLGESYYQKGDLPKSEEFFQKAKMLYEKANDADGQAKSSRALGRVQEDLHKEKEAISNYNRAKDITGKSGDVNANALNANDVSRLTRADSFEVQTGLLRENIQLGLARNDTGEIISGFSRMGEISLRNRKKNSALDAYNNAYRFSRNIPEQALQFNQRITDVYLENKNFPAAIETKKEILNESFVQNSSRIRAREIVSLANIYLLMKEDSTAIRLLNESYSLSVKNGHTLEAKTSIEQLDSIFQSKKRPDLSLLLYKDFLRELPVVISKDSSIADNRLTRETETRIKELEADKALKDEIIRRKNMFNFWLTGSVILLAVLIAVILFILHKLRVRNKKIALQSLRREMNPHFIFNSLNSINQFIAGNNELEANQYLTKFSTLMRRVMENSREDFVQFSKELELLQNYLELEKSRFPDKFDFSIETSADLEEEAEIYIPGMLIQPHLENAIWHGLRYRRGKGLLQLTFRRNAGSLAVIIEDNGIGIEESKKHKTANQKKHSGRGIDNTLERIKILNTLYRQKISCVVEDKKPAGSGVKVTMHMPVLKNINA